MRSALRHAMRPIMIAGILVAGGALAAADYQSAVALFQSERYAEAAAEFRALVEAAPSYAYGHYMLGLCSVKADDPDSAIAHFRTALDYDTSRAEYHHGLALALDEADRHQEAIDVLTAAEDRFTGPERYHLYLRRGFALAAIKKWEPAAADLRRAAEIKTTREVAERLALCYLNLSEYEQALRVLREALGPNPADPVAARIMAEANLRAAAEVDGDKRSYYSAAFEAAKGYLARAPEEPQALNLVARAALGIGRYETAVDAFRRFLGLEPAHCSAKVNLAESLIGLGRWGDAEPLLLEAVECDPGKSANHEKLGFVYRKQGKLGESLNAYRQAYGIDPTPAVQRSIDEVRHNIEVREFNEQVDEQERQWEVEQARLDDEYDREQEKVKEWIRKTE